MSMNTAGLEWLNMIPSWVWIMILVWIFLIIFITAVVAWCARRGDKDE